MTPVRLEPAALRSRVKHSTTEPLRSSFLAFNHSDVVFIMLINVKMPTIVGILTLISIIIQHLIDSKQETSSFVGILVFKSS